MIKYIINITTLLFSCVVFGQINLDQTMSPEYYVQNVLLGDGVTASNITVNAGTVDPTMPFESLGFFNASGTTFPLDSGLVLGTGNVSVAPGPNNTGNSSGITGTNVSSDIDLQSIAGSLPITSGIVLEFDFIPVGETVSFNYMFASEEYPEFAPPNGNINDQFGFFLSGTNINGSTTHDTINIALLPDGSTTVNIANINAVTNEQYYQDNVDGAAYGDAIQYDGISTILTASAQVQCGLTYHIKLALCNVSDSGWDTGVFLEGGSLKSDPLEINLSGSNVTDSIMTEGCETADILFQRSICDTLDSLTIFLAVEGTAEETIDYLGFEDTVYILQGETEVGMTINPFNDDLVEPLENFTVSAFFIASNGDTIRSSNTFYITDYVPIVLTGSDSTLNCPQDSILFQISAVNGFGNYTYTWSNNPVYSDSFAYYPATDPGVTNITVDVVDDCNGTASLDLALTLENLPEANIEIEQLYGSYPLPVAIENNNLNTIENHWYIPNNEGVYTANLNGGPNDSIVQGFEYGAYYVYTVAVSPEGCTDTAGIYFEVLELQFVTPNVFTPSLNTNAVNGQNDRFDIFPNNAAVKRITVVNRWGNVVYETENVLETWDGKDKAGDLVPEGTYFYTYYVEDFQGISYEGQKFLHIFHGE